MRNRFLDLKIIIIFCISFISKDLHAQLEFCQGNSGDPIFTENFGTGLQDSPLPNGATTYTYANGQSPDDGLYTVSSNTDYFDWFNISDITPNDTNGRMLVVNSDFTAGEFYRTTITGLCENTTYEFSSWLINLSPAGGFCGAGVIPVNVKFEIWDNTDTNLLASGATGDIFSTSSPDWNQYALVFQTIPSQTSVILKMVNNGSGGCGNDLAIDDIVFKSCGDAIAVEDDNNSTIVSICSSQAPYSGIIMAVPDNAVFSNHFYQWEFSTDGIAWLDINGETNASISISGINVTTFYRARVAEFASNLNNSDCITFSDVYQIIVNQAPMIPVIECWETATFDDATCSWIVTGTQPVRPNTECWEMAIFNNTTCAWEVTGMQPIEPTNLFCWQTTVFNNTTCVWDIIGTQPIEFRNEFLSLCEGETLILEATSSIINPTYDWDSGELTESITIDASGIFIVEVTDGCLTEVITFNVALIETPIIESITSNGSSIIITIFNQGNYLYSLNNIDFQSSNIFSNIPSGLYTIYVKANDCDELVTQEHIHFFIPKFMTPNGDGNNDFFSLNALRFFNSTEVYIFDRYGKLLFSAINRNVNWDGTFRNSLLPSSDYWYRIIIDGQEFSGHFTLKR